MAGPSRLTVVLTTNQRARLESLAARRFARRTSATFLYALELADQVLSDPSTISAETPEQAISAFVAARGGNWAELSQPSAHPSTETGAGDGS